MKDLMLPPTRGFHGTLPENVPSILKEGLRLGGDASGTIWVARDEDEAARYGGAIFEVDFTGIKGGWFDDPEVWQAHLFEPIPPDRLRLVKAP